jgi:hypothetical protein
VPPRKSTRETTDQNVEYIVKGTSPVFSALSILTFVLIVIALVLQYLELTEFYGHPVGIYF